MKNIVTQAVVGGRTLPKRWFLAWAGYRQISEEEYEVEVAIVTGKGKVNSYVWRPYREGNDLPILSDVLRQYKTFDSMKHFQR